MEHHDIEKVIFHKEDLIVLDALPSAAHSDAIILKSPRKRFYRRIFRTFPFVAVLLMAGIVGLFVALERGFLDETLTRQARIALDNALGEDISVAVGSARLRFSRDAMFALEARNVRLMEAPSGKQILNADKIALTLDPFALIAGTVSVIDVDIGKARLDGGFFAKTSGFDPAMLRVDAIPGWQTTSFMLADSLAARLVKAKTSRVTLASLHLALPPRPGFDGGVEVKNVRFHTPDKGSMRLSGTVILGRSAVDLALTLAHENGKASSLNVDIAGLALKPFLLMMSKRHGGPHNGIDAVANISLHSQRGEGATGPSFSALLNIPKGEFWADSESQAINGFQSALSYDYTKQSITVEKANLEMGPSRFPFQGAVIDIDHLMVGTKLTGYGFDFVVSEGRAAPLGSGEEPLRFNARASGFYHHEDRLVTISPISVATPFGNLAGSASVQFDIGSPEISLSVRSDEISTKALKQLWPFWVVKGARRWTHANLFAGVITNGGADVFIPGGAIVEGTPVILDSKQLLVQFDIAKTRFNFLGDIPPARNMSGHLKMSGEKLSVSAPSGEVFLPDGTSVKIADAAFSIENVYKKPLIADIKFSATGPANAMAELSAFKPIEALQKTEFSASDFSGTITAAISARIGLIKTQNPPKAEWRATLALSGVDLARPMAGRKVSDLVGVLDINPAGLALSSQGKLDGVKVEMKVTQPLENATAKDRKFNLKSSLDRDDIARFMPSIKSFITGRVDVEVELDGVGRQKIDADLTAAKLSVPWIGWKKGSGVGARATFTAETKGGKTYVSDFSLKGDGFGAKGDLVTDKSGLVSAKFSKLQLNSVDRYQLSLKRTDGGLAIDVKGNVVDLRPIIVSIKEGSSSAKESSGSKNQMRVNVSLDKALGYHKESLSDLRVKLTASDGRISSLSLSAVTKSGQAVIAKKDADQRLFEITAGDAGALARFADLYKSMSGGLINIKLKARDVGSWSGSVDIRNFSLINEARLKSIVSTRSGDGRSLNDAVKREIDVNSQKFKRGFARVVISGNNIGIENGVIRGDQVGATFQGVVRDSKGRMNMTGTFMPAYGLNRLFSELPLIGALLGNGADRGVLGITFRLAGPIQNPKLSLNPLSLIAPGVFRNIFEFE